MSKKKEYPIVTVTNAPPKPKPKPSRVLTVEIQATEKQFRDFVDGDEYDISGAISDAVESYVEVDYDDDTL